ncbi:hypothetical protein V1278_001918 [Bradyrhizobium sp. AZCC 1577]
MGRIRAEFSSLAMRAAATAPLRRAVLPASSSMRVIACIFSRGHMSFFALKRRMIAHCVC